MRHFCATTTERQYFLTSPCWPRSKTGSKKEDAYIDYTARIHPKGYKYIIVKDGIEVLAAILPVIAPTEKYMNVLREFYARCEEQYKWQQAADIARIAEQDTQEEAADDNE